LAKNFVGIRRRTRMRREVLMKRKKRSKRRQGRMEKGGERGN